MKSKSFKAPSGALLTFTELGFGTAPLGNLFRALPEEEAQATAEADLESTQLELDEMIAEQEADDRIDEALEGSANDGVLTAGEFAVAQDLFGEQLANITLEQASELGAKVCEVQTEADLVPLLREAQALIGPESTFEDAALVLGGVAGLMCADHLQDLA